MAWDPQQYLKFEGQRFRPALDLLARITAEPDRIIDLGCGTGAITSALQARWPQSAVVGLDSSDEMLAVARRDHPHLDWVQGDIAEWRPAQPFDLIYSNAALQWLDDHVSLFVRLMEALAPGGTLAVQMPHNHTQPAYTLIDELARSGRWSGRLLGVLRPTPVDDASAYYEFLAPITADIDIWETEYLQVLDGANPVADWLSGTFIRPVLQALGDDAGDFRAEWAARVAAVYPKQSDGKTSEAPRIGRCGASPGEGAVARAARPEGP